MAMLSIILLSTLVSVAGLAGCNREKPAEVHLDRRIAQAPTSTAKGPKPLRLGMGAMITPKEGYVYYYQLKEYLAEKIGRPIDLVDRDNYTEIDKMLEKRELEIGFVCSGPYVEGHDRYGLEIIAVPEVNGVSTYQAYIIVPQKSPAREFRELRGARFAFTDPKSNTGALVPTYMLARMHETPKSFFKKVIYTYGHDKSIKAVAEGVVDGAAVDSLIWNTFLRSHPEIATKVKIIARSPAYGIPPLVAVPGIDPSLKKKIREALLAMDADPAGKKILANMNIDRFVLQPDSAYESIREMEAWIARQKGQK
ncbi:MAG TPA: phosphate/phosphite/phosphonate ABC transporter substrate-binding protein [Geobacteraceae bacterium]|nr:phosphate/phosphite/phosphonate ABC transporter substrate-binding protein [Geobacteraceae bacterium]